MFCKQEPYNYRCFLRLNKCQTRARKSVFRPYQTAVQTVRHSLLYSAGDPSYRNECILLRQKLELCCRLVPILCTQECRHPSWMVYDNSKTVIREQMQLSV